MEVCTELVIGFVSLLLQCRCPNCPFATIDVEKAKFHLKSCPQRPKLSIESNQTKSVKVTNESYDKSDTEAKSCLQEAIDSYQQKSIKVTSNRKR